MKRDRYLVRRAAGARTGIAAMLAALGAAVVMTLAGCATSTQSTTTVPGGQPTPSKTTAGTPSTQPTPSKSPTGNPTRTPAGALPKATCGRVSTHGLGAATRILSADKGALSCFHVAARACKTASIAVTEMGVDTGTNHVFAIEPGGAKCAVTELSQSYSANFGGKKGKIGSTPCSVTAVSSGGVTLACAGQRLLIPAAITRISM